MGRGLESRGWFSRVRWTSQELTPPQPPLSGCHGSGASPPGWAAVGGLGSAPRRQGPSGERRLGSLLLKQPKTQKTSFPKSPALPAAALGSGCARARLRSSAPRSTQRRFSPRGGNAAAVPASRAAPLRHASLRERPWRGAPRSAAFPTPRPATPPAATAGSRCAAENPRLCLVSIFSSVVLETLREHSFAPAFWCRTAFGGLVPKPAPTQARASSAWASRGRAALGLGVKTWRLP